VEANPLILSATHPHHGHTHTGSVKRLIRAPLLRRESIGDAYHVLTFEVPAGIAASSGQFLMARGANWGDAPLLARPMSLLCGGTEPAVLIKVVGEGTSRMARAEPGEFFTLLAPLGSGWKTPNPALNPVLVAGGVGVAPLMFLARELHARGIRPTFIYGGRSARDLPLDDEVAAVSELYLTTEDGSRATQGRVTDVLDRVVHSSAEVFTCGPERMMARVTAICRDRSLPCHASLETRMACGYGVCLGCAVPLVGGQYLYACMDGPCVDAHTIEWNRTGETLPVGECEPPRPEGLRP
jgi:dihydroorotate dehydrogenase electron transfer subunit